jgi:chromosome partitioning protein
VDDIITVEEAAQYLRLHVKTVQRWCREGRLPAMRAGNRYRVRSEDVRNLGGGTTVSTTLTSIPRLVEARSLTRRSLVLAVANQKGGVGKTVTTQALGTALADMGDQVLLVDMDPQASLTDTLGFVPAELAPTVYDLLDHYVQTDEAADPQSAIRRVDGHLALLPSNLRLSMLEIALLNCARREYVLGEALGSLRDSYDWILIDCPPSLSLLTVNALTCADQVIIPVQPEPMVTAVIKSFLDTVLGIRRKKLNPDLQVAGIVLTRIDSRPVVNREVIEDLKESVRGSIPILGEVRASARVQEATALRTPITRYRPAAEAATAYRQIAEVLRNARERK